MLMLMKEPDDIRDLAIKIVDHLVERGLVKDCVDSNDETEFEFQDAIVEVLTTIGGE